MKKNILVFILTMSLPFSAFASKLKVITTYPYIASITQEIAGTRADIQSLADGKSDPHFIVPRPSYIAKLRDADLLIINGGELEIGWLPPLSSQASNPKLLGQGTLDLSQYVRLQEIPHDISRAMGDVHPSGNPHFSLDPDNIIPLAEAIHERLAMLDPENAPAYKVGLGTFIKKWKDRMDIWNRSMSSLKGGSVVQYHSLYHYLLSRYLIKSAGTIERLPGIPPTSQHIVSLEKIIQENHVKVIIQDVFHPDDAARYLAKKLNLRLIYLPNDVRSTPHTETIFELFDEIVKRLTHD